MLRYFLLIFLGFLSVIVQAQNFAGIQQIGNSNFSSYPGQCTFDANNNGYFVGAFNGTVDFDPGIGVYNTTAIGYANMFLLKKTSNDSFLWAKTFHGRTTAPYYATLFPNAILLDKSSNILIAGAFIDTFDFDPGPNDYILGATSSPSFFQENSFILKLDSIGNFIWANRIGGGIGDNASIRDMKINKNGETYLLYTFNGTVDFDPGPNVNNLTSVGLNDIVIEKLDSAGNFLWTKQIGSSSFDVAYSLALDSLSNIYFCGSYQGTCDFDPGAGVANLTSNGDYDISVVKLDSAGNYVWAKSIGGSQHDDAYGLTVDPFGNVLVVGYFRGTVDFDPGPGVFNLTYGNNSVSTNPFVLKLDNAGNFKWAKTYNTINSTNRSVTTDSAGNVYFTGEFAGGDLNPPLLYTAPSQGGRDVNVEKMDSSGNMLWARVFGTNGDDVGGWIGLHGNSVYITGTLASNGSGTGDCDPGAGMYTVTAGNNGFIEKLDACPSATASISGDTEVCHGDTAHYLLNNTATGAKVKWMVNHVVKDTNATNYAYVPVNGDTISVLITIPMTLCYDITYLYTNSIIVQVDTNIIPSISITAPAVVNVGQQVTVTANVANAGASYNIVWKKNGVYFSTTSVPSLIYTKQSGTDTITAIVYPQTVGCYDTTISNNQIIASTNSINTLLTSQNLQLYPNPSSGIFNIVSSANIQQIIITDITGKTVYQDKPNTQNAMIDLSEKAAGIYFYQVILNQQRFNGKLILHKE